MSGSRKPALDTVLESFAALGERLRSRDDSTDESAGVLEREALGVQESIQAFHLARHLMRVDPHGAGGVLGVRGRPVPLSVGVHRLLDNVKAGWKLRFVVAGQTVAQGITTEDGVARTALVSPDAGVIELGFAIDDPDGNPLRSERDNPKIFVQVVDREPVVAVDADLLFPAEGQAEPDLAALGVLDAAGCVLCYLDVSAEDRLEAARRRIAELELPRGVWLPSVLNDIGLGEGQADFRVTLAVQGLRRLRAQGVPVIAAVTGVSEEQGLDTPAQVEGIAVVSPAQLHSLAERPSGLATLQAEAQAFAEERDATWRREEEGDPGPAQDRCLDIMTATSVCAGNTLHFEPDNRRARERLFELIEGAQRSVHLQAYILNEGHFTDHLLVRLIGRARAGVQVRLALDALYSGHGVLGSKNPGVKALLEEPGVEVLAIDPISLTSTIDATLIKQRDHRKLLVVDDRVGIVTGRNLADLYYTGFDESPITDTTPDEKIPWLDAHVEVHGPLVQRIQHIFLELWQRHGGRPPDPEDSAIRQSPPQTPPPAGACGDARARLIFHDGLQDSNALSAYEALVLRARERICIVNDFPMISTLAEALAQARARGLRVQVLTGSALARKASGEFFPGSVARRMFEYMTKRRYERLVRAGIEVFELTVPPGPLQVVHGGAIRPYVHAKVMAVDGRLVCLGSANLDIAASYWEREVNVLADSRPFATAVERWFDAQLDHALRLDIHSESWKRERAERAIADTLWPDFLYS